MGALQRKEAARKERMGKNVRRELAGAEVKPTEYGVNVMLPFEGTFITIQVFSRYPGLAHAAMHSMKIATKDDVMAQSKRANEYFDSIKSQLEGLVKNA